jgi:hypothetical protein
MLMLAAWWPLATGNVTGCIVACRHAAAAMAHHGHQHGTMSHAAHHGPNIGRSGPCASVQPLALVATPATPPMIASPLAVAVRARARPYSRLVAVAPTPEPPPPRA